MRVLEVYGTMKQQRKWWKDPGSQSEKDLGMSYSGITVRLCGLGPLCEPRYSHLLSGAQYFTNSIVGEEG